MSYPASLTISRYRSALPSKPMPGNSRRRMWPFSTVTPPREPWRMPGYALPPANLYVYYLSRRHLPAKVRAFIDFLVAEFKAK